VLLTGGTGFIGPFLIKSLLEQTQAKIHVLVRSSNEAQGMQRLKAAMESMGPCPAGLMEMFDARVLPVCGDLGQPKLGLTQETWDFLATEMDSIFHNGATVNYLFNYDRMRDANVLGTNEILKLAFEGKTKSLNYVSTTFIFGWAVKSVLYETDCNKDMELLDFGYSQSKWVAERVVEDARSKGLCVRIFRPALVSPSVTGGGNNFDIAVRLVAFMVNHGIGVDALNQVSFVPADVVANNIVAISTTPGTETRPTRGARRLREHDGHHEPDHQADGSAVRDLQHHGLRAGADSSLPQGRSAVPAARLPGRGRWTTFRRWSSSATTAREYQKARDAATWGVPEPTLEETVSGILKFMHRKGIISVAARESGYGDATATATDAAVSATQVTAS
jgi:thioester reductase-like protein